MSYIEELGMRAKAASVTLNRLGQKEKNKGLIACADALIAHTDQILAENEKDVENAVKKGVKASLIDRLKLNRERIAGMADGLRQIAALKDPIGAMTGMETLPNGLMVGKRVVPLGVIGMIYESRPNVTADAFGLCFKTGNAVILRGGSDALISNQAVLKALHEALAAEGLPTDAVLLVEKNDHETAVEMMKCNQYLDVLIPRGGAGLIQTVVNNSTVPVIETGVGNCHIYVDASADPSMAVSIIENAKTQRMGVCNACESLVIHKDIAKTVLPMIVKCLSAHKIEMRGDEAARALCSEILPATEEDWGQEYLDAIISIKLVDCFDEAVAHINRYNTGHSEAIITKDYDNATQFVQQIDAAAVYVNASTRFTDGNEFGFGAEIGISTQKLHVRGPMGLQALTTTKYIILGNGQIRS